MASYPERSAETEGQRSGLVLKRVVDVTIAVVLLLFLLPLFATIALAILLDDGRPIFHTCRRVGQRGRPLPLRKFRKMTAGANGLPLTQPDDLRLTRVGKFLVKWKLDELPQLWNVVRGDMSLVGPRPEDERFVALHPSSYAQILEVRPGITGLGQLAFVREAELLAGTDPVTVYVDRLLPQKVGIDLMYARTRTIAMDVTILAWTLVTILLGRDVAVNRSTGHLGVRRRPTPEHQNLPTRGFIALSSEPS